LRRGNRTTEALLKIEQLRRGHAASRISIASRLPIATVKWSATAYATPLIDISGLEFFRNLDSGNHYFFLDDLPFRLDSVLPPNQENYVAVLGMKTEDCAGPDLEDAKFAFLSTRALSLIDPTLPLGFGFALVDDTGTVLFHSDKYRNNRENFLVETSYDVHPTTIRRAPASRWPVASFGVFLRHQRRSCRSRARRVRCERSIRG
jgi:hypothetical protein